MESGFQMPKNVLLPAGKAIYKASFWVSPFQTRNYKKIY